jgi:hypothetical protein
MLRERLFKWQFLKGQYTTFRLAVHQDQLRPELGHHVMSRVQTYLLSRPSSAQFTLGVYSFVMASAYCSSLFSIIIIIVFLLMCLVVLSPTSPLPAGGAWCGMAVEGVESSISQFVVRPDLAVDERHLR